MLSTSGLYQVCSGDVSKAAVDAIAARYKGVQAQQVDFSDQKSLDAFLKGLWGVVSCAPYHCNPLIAERAKAHGVHYFDLTEDVEVTQKVKQLAEGSKSAFAPQCGLAPGFITIVANHLIREMTDVQDLRLRVGALPRYPSNRLKYNLTWSTEGLINEYCNQCEALLDGELQFVQPRQDLENLTIDGVE
jgi:saccharopine dehydrogenase-like NADP-dependent oxidoreductase